MAGLYLKDLLKILNRPIILILLELLDPKSALRPRVKTLPVPASYRVVHLSRLSTWFSYYPFV